MFFSNYVKLPEVERTPKFQIIKYPLYKFTYKLCLQFKMKI
jgi:hypothetical protein